MTEIAPIRILLADDHRIVREGLRLILESMPGFEVVAEAADGVMAVELAEQLVPQVILMDLRMPRLDGISAIQSILRTQPTIAIVILTTYNEDDLMLHGLRAGARGYLLKDTDRETLFNTIRAAVRGETLLHPSILARMLSLTETPLESTPSPETVLTQRELEILGHVSQGSRNKEIAQQLNITERTVKAHLDNIYSKLGVDSRTAAVMVAIQHGWLS
ncbi:MAG: response regulator transcription factor [Chloroflexota bacterium]